MIRTRRWYLLAGGLLTGAVLLTALFAGQLTTLSPSYWDAPAGVMAPQPPFPPGPATAFLIAVTGFHLLSQGLEGIVFAPDRWREATTGRLSRRWRWAVLPLTALAVVWYCGGAPWGREAGIYELATQQARALSRGQWSGFQITLAPDNPAYQRERQHWFARAVSGSVRRAAVRPEAILNGPAAAKGESPPKANLPMYVG